MNRHLIPGSGNAVPDAGRAIRLHFLVAGARDRPPRRRRLRFRAAGGGRRAAGAMAAQPILIQRDRFTNTHAHQDQGNSMKTTTRLLLIACLVLPCRWAPARRKKRRRKRSKAPLTAPTTERRERLERVPDRRGHPQHRRRHQHLRVRAAAGRKPPTSRATTTASWKRRRATSRAACVRRQPAGLRLAELGQERRPGRRRVRQGRSRAR